MGTRGRERARAKRNRQQTGPPHWWLNVPYDSSIVIVRNSAHRAAMTSAGISNRRPAPARTRSTGCRVSARPRHRRRPPLPRPAGVSRSSTSFARAHRRLPICCAPKRRARSQRRRSQSVPVALVTMEAARRSSHHEEGRTCRMAGTTWHGRDAISVGTGRRVKRTSPARRTPFYARQRRSGSRRLFCGRVRRVAKANAAVRCGGGGDPPRVGRVTIGALLDRCFIGPLVARALRVTTRRQASASRAAGSFRPSILCSITRAVVVWLNPRRRCGVPSRAPIDAIGSHRPPVSFRRRYWRHFRARRCRYRRCSVHLAKRAAARHPVSSLEYRAAGKYGQSGIGDYTAHAAYLEG